MTVSSSTAKVSYSGNGATQAFAVPFYFLANSQLLVVLRSSIGAEITQVLGTNYTVTGAGVLTGGTVTMTVAPPTGTTLTIARNVPLTQETDLQPNDRLPAETLEQSIDKLTMITQQIDEATDRTLKFPLTDSSSISSVLPTSSERAGKYLAFSNTGAPIVEGIPPGAANVRTFGAVGDGVTDDTLAIQNAVNASDAVYFPAGIYRLTAAVTLKTNNTVFGEGASSVILYTGTAATQGAFFTNSGSATAYVDNITIRDLKFLGQVASLGFNEFIHLISMNGVRNCLIEHCVVEGFRGDGIYIGSGDLAGQERHNINVTIRDCYIDGINKDNRNGISVIDGAGITIENNYITRTSRSNMPGAIDIEPDSNTYHVIRDISILNNYISNIGGNVAAVSVFLPGVNYTTPPYGFNISGNYIENLDGLFGSSAVFFNYAVSGGLSESTAQFGIRYTNNVFRPGAARAIVVFNANDIVFEGNTIIGGGTSLIGFTPNVNVLDCTLRSNMFADVQPAVGGAALQIFTCSRLTLDGNVFKNCGNPAGPGGGGAIIFSTGTSSALKLINNSIVSNDGSTVVAMYNDGSHTFDPDTNIFLNNNIAAGTVNFRLGSNVTPFSLGLNVPPSSWNYNYKVVEGGSSIGQGWVGFRNDSSASLLGSNCYYDGTNWRYKFNAAASFVEQENGFFVWNVATAGLAGDPITFAQPLSLNSLGLGIGTVASVYPLQVDGGAGNAAGFESNSGTVQITATDGTVQQAVGYANATTAFHGTLTNHELGLLTNNTSRVIVKNTGQVNFVPLASAPSGASAGDVYYNSGTNKLQVYNGTSWVDLH